MRAAVLAAALATGLAASPAMAGEVVITVTDLRSTKGVVRACMTTREDVFPKCIKDPASHRTVVPAGEKVEIRFTGVKPGNYAIALLHDENDNGKADRALGMMPKEGYGFSRDAPVKMAPPKFNDAVFTQGEGTNRMTIKMRYFL
ncbi:DUF2141 domain-containing protein [Erythrobacter sp. sf7]|uniref:DUF2141 domain-containing protein n=1 Tax=Erythrobacter fulvus TaxID=2987523 RepID=A0ABT5JRR0_9SPHN|nr:DUF2141 domain-containing protein [Erythrobacter fulvus]MDC8755450.1 DUF2141 domain-containing protein [Erythrobacter fulvus]